MSLVGVSNPQLEDAVPHGPLIAWVEAVAELTNPDRIHWCDGSETEWKALTEELVGKGTLVRLNAQRAPPPPRTRSGR